MKKAFTLIELLLVVAILGVLAGMVVIRFTGTQGSARDATRRSDLRQYQNALEVYANRNQGLYPSQPSSVAVTSLCGSTVLNIAATCPDDPRVAVTGTPRYQYQSNAAGTNYVLWARLERPNDAGAALNFVVCSNGNVGTALATVTISGGNCPI